MAQAAEQPSADTSPPSSHSSAPTRSPSPHTLAHTSALLTEPPAHANPGSIVQLALHPSPATVLLSSQPSPPHEIRLPSPHTAAHVSSPPTPEPSPSPPPDCVELVHAKPTCEGEG